MKKRFTFAILVCIVAASPSITTTAQEPAVTFPVIVTLRDDIPFDDFRGNYRAVQHRNPAAWNYLDRGVVAIVQALESRVGFRASYVYSAALKGFAATLTAGQVARLQNHPWVAFVEPDGMMAVDQPDRNLPPPTTGQEIPWGVERVGATVSSTLAGDGNGAVSNVNVYILDTGLDVSHADLNVTGFVNLVDDGIETDCHGHGTHVAGTVAAADNIIDAVGVAPGAPLIGVKVLECSGWGATSWVVKGVDWVTRHAVLPAVANMSLTGGASRTLDRVVKRSAGTGIVYAVAAGNYGADACNYSPARTGTNDGIITTAATDYLDLEALWSNYGGCVDIWAPGVGILSTMLGGGTTIFSGTSMAAPHVAGTAALYLSSHPEASPAEVELALKNDASSTSTESKDGRAIKRVNARLY